ncbi:SLAP domain-containing protein [Lacticaseibacillus brantae]|uniref:S-layer protein C-terminal domain-containing protein n=1 Tax=Lacticaseibacillus brantae DSM 23927 TaxID=1423727 RepID=A0A0R2B3A4_9LACO|nr:SLAP domain-containing protein [Lacticaseibacillus brantae]KRM72436.1 hypothetical protein FC34_GL000141 [Lacticaseibacillus brantae DSM 23927]
MKKSTLLLSTALLGISLGTLSPVVSAASVKPVVTSASVAAKGVVTINYVKGYGVALWNSPDANRKPVANRTLATGSAWKYFATKTVNGQLWYQLGNNQWVSGKYAIEKTVSTPAPETPSYQPVTGTATIRYVKGYGVALWTNYTAAKKVITGRKLLDGTKWHVTQVAGIGSQVWYNLGGNQWVDGRYVTFVADKPATSLSDSQFAVLAMQQAQKLSGIKLSNIKAWPVTKNADGSREVKVAEDQPNAVQTATIAVYRLTTANALQKLDVAHNTWQTVLTNALTA